LEVSVSKALLILASLMETISPCKSLSSNGSWNDPQSPLSQHQLLTLRRSLTRKPPQTFPHQALPRKGQPAQLDSPCSLGQHIFQCKSEIVDQSDYKLISKRNFLPCIMNSHVNRLVKITSENIHTNGYSTSTSPFKCSWFTMQWKGLNIYLITACSAAVGSWEERTNISVAKNALVVWALNFRVSKANEIKLNFANLGLARLALWLICERKKTFFGEP